VLDATPGGLRLPCVTPNTRCPLTNETRRNATYHSRETVQTTGASSQLPANARWTVVEVSKIVAEGPRVAAREAAVGLEFEIALDAIPNCDILLSAGALQYMERSVPGLLDLRASKPPHVILNKVPLTVGETYWTLQNFGTAISPYRIYNEAEFIGYFQNAGYALKDRWDMAELSCIIPFHPDKCVRRYTGLYFERLA
jgi:putative methyltransferase (TIGR04325 family)